MPPPYMFHFSAHEGSEPKTLVSVGTLPGHIDPAAPPTKKQPWKTINDVPFVQSLSLILPGELYDVVWNKIRDELKQARYAKVIMKLQDVLEDSFFTQYVKRGEFSRFL